MIHTIDKLIQYLTVDLNIYDLQSIRLKQYNKNSQQLIITITENNQPYCVDKDSVTCAFKMITPDDRAIYNNCTINDDGTITVDITESCCAKPGRGEAELNMFTKDNFQICTMNFTIIIEKSVYSNDKIIAAPEFDILTNIIVDGKKLNEHITENENERNVAEELRKQNEASRMEAENARSDNEAARILAESSRMDNENKRLDAEQIREQTLSATIDELKQLKADVIEASKNANDAAELCRNMSLLVNDDGVLCLDI